MGMSSIRLDMIERICYGNSEHMTAILEEAQMELQRFQDDWTDIKECRPSEEMFRALHTTKTTLSMLQAGRHIQACQVLLDRYEQLKISEITPFTTSLSRVISDIEKQLILLKA